MGGMGVQRKSTDHMQPDCVTTVTQGFYTALASLKSTLYRLGIVLALELTAGVKPVL